MTLSRSTATALWITGPGKADLRDTGIGALAPGEVEVEAVWSGISRGTESLVFRGMVPESEHERMRCPFQEGGFPHPVKYGYAMVGRLRRGPPDRIGQWIFCLHPHQDRFALPEEAAIAIPDTVPSERAVLAANMETALNIAWDAGFLPCDRIAVVGAGTVGLLTAWLAAQIPGVEVTVVDIAPERADIAHRLGCAFALPDEAPQDCDVVVHASATSEGLATALTACGFEARLVEASWYGERQVTLPLGGVFHSRRISLVSSQVGAVSPARRARRSHADRMRQALGLLAAPALDSLISGETPFSSLGEDYARILADPATLCHRIRYS
ncbi:L-threonine 3-dehydrogenase [Hartmannibacter diazotrophicus]|uniref:L-threonine 3-dehydrogenase n=1 Tax=Hartmannibacter diazotrophicus TaxID=1482074 RepID=A0A2C9DD00_9HYPH|nr:zinc-binding alcohol dehydrogenase [Hartmannibacter diazotrophicus]SON57611.1 L-threonine 3-dehydrogenase [Hartmannibacter diazotrophicus]